MSAECKRVSLTTNQCTLIHLSQSRADGCFGSETREASRIAIAGNFYKNISSFKFVFHEKWLLFKRLDFNNCTGPNKVRIELKILKINNHLDPI